MDRLIDDVARSVSAGETPALRTRVVANLGRQRRRSTGVVLPAVVLASAAAVAIAAHWPPSRPVQESDSRTAAPPTVVARADVPIAATPSRAETTVAPATGTTQTAAGAASDSGLEDAPTIAALPAIDAVPVGEIQPKPLGVPQLNVEHVANVAPLTVAALDEINRGR